MFFILNIIDPLYIRLNIYTSVILYELHLALLESAARISENKAESKGMHDEAKVLLSKALDILKNEINHINTEKIEFDYCVRNVNRYPSKFIIVILLYLFRYCQANMAIYLIKIHIIIFFVLFNILFFIFSFSFGLFLSIF